MISRRKFLYQSSISALSVPFLHEDMTGIPKHRRNIGVQLYSVRVEMNQDAKGTLAKLAAMGYNQIESAR
ncbi:MAG TPA: hypothetical protein PKL70_17450, partial [Saprospiraceae bacterium]|nr:hypothetical protein [Saprospiraceae bacterium]